MSAQQRFHYDGVEGLRVGRYRVGISTSCVVYRVGSTAIDIGPPNQWSLVRSFLQEGNVSRIVLTHHHEDHSGGGERAQTELGASVFAPRLAVEKLREGFPLRRYQRIVWGSPRQFRAQVIPEQWEAGAGIRLRSIAAPGHAEDMTCYLAPDRGWLFAGDLFISRRPRYLRIDENLAQQMQSLHAVLALDFQVVFCGHRGVVEQGRRALRDKLDYLQALCAHVQHLERRGNSPSQITAALLGRMDLMRALTNGHFSKRNLIEQCLRDPGEGAAP